MSNRKTKTIQYADHSQRHALKSLRRAIAASEAEDDTDERATQLFTALTYVSDLGLACLWRHDQDMKAPLLSPETLNDLIEKHALRLEAQARALEAEASAHAQRLLDSFREAPYVGQAAARALVDASKEDCDRLLANAAEARAAKVRVGETP